MLDAAMRRWGAGVVVWTAIAWIGTMMPWIAATPNGFVANGFTTGVELLLVSLPNWLPFALCGVAVLYAFLQAIGIGDRKSSVPGVLAGFGVAICGLAIIELLLTQTHESNRYPGYLDQGMGQPMQ